MKSRVACCLGKLWNNGIYLEWPSYFENQNNCITKTNTESNSMFSVLPETCYNLNTSSNKKFSTENKIKKISDISAENFY